MVSMKILRIDFFIVNFILINECLAGHYWKISDDGKKIKAVPDSPYVLAHPGSLPDFLKQYENVKQFGESFVELSSVLKSISEREKMDEPEIEQRLRTENSNCQGSSSFSLDRDNFKTSYSIELCPEFHKSFERYIMSLKQYFENPPDDEKLRPSCRQWHTAGHFRGLKEDISAQELKGSFPDLDYSHIIDGYFPKVINYTPSSSKKYGTALAGLLSHVDKRIRENPYIHIAAAAFWRVTGNLDEAFECYRTGIIYAEKASFSTTSDTAEQLSLYTIYIATATLLNRANLPEYSLALLDHNFGKDARPGIPHSPCVLFMVQSATADASAIGESSNDENKSVISPLPFISIIRVKKYSPAMLYYSQALKTEELIPIFEKEQMPQHSHLVEKIWRKMRAMICQMDIIVELEQQKDNLEKLVTEKLYFNEVYRDQIRVEEQIRRRMISDENRRYLKLSYEEAKYGYNPYRICRATIGKRFPFSNNPANVAGVLLCETTDSVAYEEYMLPARKRTLKNRPLMNNTVWRIAELFTRDRLYDKKVESLRDKKIDGLHLAKRYPLNSAEMFSLRNRFWRRPDWPNNIDCQSIISRSDLLSPKWFPQIFISPENKGFLISDYLTLFIGLDSNDEHPLPWNEPYCDNIQDMNQEQFSFISNMLIALNKERKNEWAEPRLKSILVRLADRIMEDIEIGQRINTLLTNNIGPRWIALNIAGLYWRVVGNPRQATLCLVDAILNEPKFSDIALVQLAQVVLKVSGNKHEATKLLLKARDIGHEEPNIHWLLGRIALLSSDIDLALRHFKNALDRNPFDETISEDLLKAACSGKSSKSTVSSLHPTVWCSPAIQNAVCFKKRQTHREQCYVVDPEDERNRRLIYNRCNGVYTGVSYKTPPYVNIVSPFLPIFKTVFKRDNPFVDDAGGVQTIETEELPLDYGGSEPFFAIPPVEWWTRAKNEMRYEKRVDEASIDKWEEEIEGDLAIIPPKPLSFLWIKNKREMLKFDLHLPSILPSPSMHQIRRGLSKFPPPRQSHSVCSGVNKLSVLLENQVSTWVSITAKGEDIEKYVDLRGPVPGIAGLQPVCPSIERTEASPVLGFDHIPAFAMSDQFLFYKPEKALTDALKSLGNERDTIEHVAARLHTALLADGMGKNGHRVNWLLCVLSSLYWRVMGDAPRAVGCLRCALQSAPLHMRDVALVSLANICHQAGFLHSALIAAGAALSASPNLVAIHFTIANIYASIGDYQRALEFYYSTISLQSNFEPAKERIRAIYCYSEESFNFQAI